MFDFRSGAGWKVIIGIIYYSLCFLGFMDGLGTGLVVLLVAGTTPVFVVEMYKLFKTKNVECLYAIPAWLLPISIAVPIYKYRDNFNIKTAPPEEDAGYTFYNSEFFDRKVYITRHGEKYHKKDCSVIEGSETVGISLREALEASKTPCSKCND